MMQKLYDIQPYPTKQTISDLSKVINVTENRIKVWFQNNRQKQRSWGHVRRTIESS